MNIIYEGTFASRDIAIDMDTEVPEYVITLMQECWAEDPEVR